MIPYRLALVPQLRAPWLRLLGARVGPARPSSTTCASSTSTAAGWPAWRSATSASSATSACSTSPRASASSGRSPSPSGCWCSPTRTWATRDHPLQAHFPAMAAPVVVETGRLRRRERDRAARGADRRPRRSWPPAAWSPPTCRPDTLVAGVPARAAAPDRLRGHGPVSAAGRREALAAAARRRRRVPALPARRRCPGRASTSATSSLHFLPAAPAGPRRAARGRGAPLEPATCTRASPSPCPPSATPSTCCSCCARTRRASRWSSPSTCRWPRVGFFALARRLLEAPPAAAAAGRARLRPGRLRPLDRQPLRVRGGGGLGAPRGPRPGPGPDGRRPTRGGRGGPRRSAVALSTTGVEIVAQAVVVGVLLGLRPEAARPAWPLGARRGGARPRRRSSPRRSCVLVASQVGDERPRTGLRDRRRAGPLGPPLHPAAGGWWPASTATSPTWPTSGGGRTSSPGASPTS